MKKFYVIIRTALAEYFVYRVAFMLWRLRQVINLLITFFLWSSIFEGRQSLFGYNQQEMLTYILLSSIVSNFALGTRTTDISDEIRTGGIMNKLLRPISFFKSQLVIEYADKLLNLTLAIIEVTVLIFLLKPNLYIQPDLAVYPVFLIFFLLGGTIAFFINLSLALIAFWTPETWAPRFIFFILIFFLSGTYFPLDILPKPLYYALLASPFPYLYYFPTKIYLDGIGPYLLPLSAAYIFWIFATYYISKILWKAGLKSYSFYGR